MLNVLQGQKDEAVLLLKKNLAEKKNQMAQGKGCILWGLKLNIQKTKIMASGSITHGK